MFWQICKTYYIKLVFCRRWSEVCGNLFIFIFQKILSTEKELVSKTALGTSVNTGSKEGEGGGGKRGEGRVQGREGQGGVTQGQGGVTQGQGGVTEGRTKAKVLAQERTTHVVRTVPDTDPDLVQIRANKSEVKKTLQTYLNLLIDI